MILRTRALLPALLLVAACHEGGGTTTAGLPLGTFSVQNVFFESGTDSVRLDGRIAITFDREVDFETVSANTFRIFVNPGQSIPDPASPGALLDVGGLSALGDFVLVEPRTIRFQPICPQTDDVTHAGFFPEVKYTLELPALATGGVSITAGDGTAVLDEPLVIEFKTVGPSSGVPLFTDREPGPPAPVLHVAGSAVEEASRLVIGGDASAAVPLELVPGADGSAPAGFAAPLNLYSDPATSVHVIVTLDQAVAPTPENVSNDRVRLEYLGLEPLPAWHDLPCDVVLENNCGAGGAELRLIPIGVLPQGRRLRVVLTAGFEDLVGEALVGDGVVVAAFDTLVPVDPGTSTPGDAVDEIFEDFSVAGSVSREDASATFEVPRAAWDADGAGVLRAVGFEGTGGPGGEFDLVLAAGEDHVFDTTSQTFLGGPGGGPTVEHEFVGGVLDVRNLTVEDGAHLRIVGPNPAVVLASGDVVVRGRISANGAPATSVDVLNMAWDPQLGARGVAGGGNGGTGSPLTFQSSPRGGAGHSGITGVLGGGGGGGESGISTTSVNFGENRRGGGGGGGVLGHDRVLASGCPDESFIGLNAEPGHLGASTCLGAVAMLSPPQGGVPGAGPFADSLDENDFWGTMLVAPGTPTARLVRGELERPWAGAGGGAGGDATTYIAAIGYPNPNFPQTSEDIGAGGGGGAGSITILALGSITLGPQGRIEANGGTGAGGENTNFANRVGGGSGGGSGGHIVLQSAQRIDLSQVPVAPGACAGGIQTQAYDCLALVALGGQGGVGAANTGGFDPNWAGSGIPEIDAKPQVFGDGGAPCIASPRVCAGGDGGPGIVQLHAPTLADILPPGGVDANLGSVSVPAPYGFERATGQWAAQLLPAFDARSRARSKWVPLGRVALGPDSEAAEQVRLLLRGTDPLTGAVRASGGTVESLPPLLAGVLSASGGLPRLEADGRTLVWPVAELTGEGDLYRRNPRLLELFELRVDGGGPAGARLEVAHAESDELAGELRLTLAEDVGSGDLATLVSGATVELIPRFFLLHTDGVRDALPEGTAVRLRLQVAPATADGLPDEENAGPLTSDPAQVGLQASARGVRFLRFVVEFDLGADGRPLAVDAPRPSLEFLRVPVRF